MKYSQIKDGCDKKLYDGTAVNPVLELSPRRSGSVFVLGEEINVSDAPVFQLTIVGVVLIVGAAPIFERDRTEKARDKTNGIVPFTGPQKGLVTAVMLDDEDAYQKKSGHDSQTQGQQIGPGNAEIHEDYQADKWQKRIEDLNKGLF